MHKISFYLSMGVLVLSVPFFAACSGNQDDAPETTPIINIINNDTDSPSITSILIAGATSSSPLLLGVDGKVATLAVSAITFPRDVENDAVEWFSSDERVFTVVSSSTNSSQATVTVVGRGVAKLIAVASNGVSDTVEMAVGKDVAVNTAVEQISFVDMGDDITLRIGKTTLALNNKAVSGEQSTMTLQAQVVPETLAPTLTWTSSNPHVVEIADVLGGDIGNASTDTSQVDTETPTGTLVELRAMSEGFSIITATTPSGVSSTLNVSVGRYPVTGLSWVRDEFLVFDKKINLEKNYNLSSYLVFESDTPGVLPTNRAVRYTLTPLYGDQMTDIEVLSLNPDTGQLRVVSKPGKMQDVLVTATAVDGGVSASTILTIGFTYAFTPASAEYKGLCGSNDQRVAVFSDLHRHKLTNTSVLLVDDEGNPLDLGAENLALQPNTVRNWIEVCAINGKVASDFKDELIFQVGLDTVVRAETPYLNWLTSDQHLWSGNAIGEGAEVGELGTLDLSAMLSVSKGLRGDLKYSVTDASTPEVSLNVATISPQGVLVGGSLDGAITPQKVVVTASSGSYTDTFTMFIGYTMTSVDEDSFDSASFGVVCEVEKQPLVVFTHGAEGYEALITDNTADEDGGSQGNIVRVGGSSDGYIAYCYDTAISPAILEVDLDLDGKVNIVKTEIPVLEWISGGDERLWSGTNGGDLIKLQTPGTIDISSMLLVSNALKGDLQYSIEDVSVPDVVTENTATISADGVISAGSTDGRVTPQKVVITASSDTHEAAFTMFIGYSIASIYDDNYEDVRDENNACGKEEPLVIVNHGIPGFANLIPHPSDIEGLSGSKSGTGEGSYYVAVYCFDDEEQAHPSISLDLDLDGIVEVIGRELRLESKYPEGFLWDGTDLSTPAGSGDPGDAPLGRLFTISEPLQSTLEYTLVDSSDSAVTTNGATIDTVNQRIVAGVTNGEVTPQKVTITATATDNSVEPPVEYSDTLDLYIGYKISRPFDEDFRVLEESVRRYSGVQPIAIVTGGTAGYEKYVTDPVDTSLGGFNRYVTEDYIAYYRSIFAKPEEIQLHLYFNEFSGNVIITIPHNPLRWQYKTEKNHFLWNGLSKQYDFSTLLNVDDGFEGDVEYTVESTYSRFDLSEESMANINPEENIATITPEGMLTVGQLGDSVKTQTVNITAISGGYYVSTRVYIGYTIYLGDEHPQAVEACATWNTDTTISKPLVVFADAAYPWQGQLFKDSRYNKINNIVGSTFTYERELPFFFYDHYLSNSYKKYTEYPVANSYNAAEPNPDATQFVLDLDLDGELVIDVPPFTDDTTTTD